MDKQNLRFFFLLALLTAGMFLYNAWQVERVQVQSAPNSLNNTNNPDSGNQSVDNSSGTAIESVKHRVDLPVEPEHAATLGGGKLAAGHPQVDVNVALADQIAVHTDVMDLIIDRNGGDIIHLDLPLYPRVLLNKNDGFVLLDNTEERYYIAQSGLLNEAGPDSAKLGRATYKTDKNAYSLDGDKLNVDLRYKTANGVDIIKRLVFSKGSYVVTVEYLINNHGSSEYKASMFGSLRRIKPSEQSASILNPMRTYTGAAVNTPEKKYQKLSFDDMEKKPFKQSVVGGWAAIVEHYFISAWLPSRTEKNYYQSEVFADKSFGIGFVGQQIVVQPGQNSVVTAELYMGPRITDVLKSLAPGLDLTVDFGMLWWLCQPIFWVLKLLFTWVGNWGVAIILITCAIKLMFFRLSATSYRSMGNMKKLQPRIEALKQQCGDNKQQFSQAVMDLYKREKVNPFGGCLPMLIQIPVFIALYYVLLESVELRHAPFALWITDLSAKDPFYVLPLLMGASMLLQQKMNPAPADPVQAKVMMAMPIVFTVVFLNFPAGLVLYWVVNNSLSIAQQWYITTKLEVAK